MPKKEELLLELIKFTIQFTEKLRKEVKEKEKPVYFPSGGVMHGDETVLSDAEKLHAKQTSEEIKRKLDKSGITSSSFDKKPDLFDCLPMGIHPGMEKPEEFKFGNWGNVNHKVTIFKGYVQSCELDEFKLSLNDLRTIAQFCLVEDIEVGGYSVSCDEKYYTIGPIRGIYIKDIQTLINRLKKQQA